ncbi:MAG: hypothetical protein V1902_02835 [Candidatus Falkowbacteria bacterium]
MALMSDRKETQDEIVIVFKYQAAWYLFLLIALVASFFTRRLELEMYMIAGLVVVSCVFIFGKAKANSEVKRAMKNGKVQVSGSRFSFRNPITFTIKK